MTEPRAYTEAEIIDKIMGHTKALVRYWASQPGMTDLEKCDGVAFSIFSMLDGSTMSLPAIDLVVCPHEEDKQFNIDEGSNWFEPETRISVPLHEYYSMYGKEKKHV